MPVTRVQYPAKSAGWLIRELCVFPALHKQHMGSKYMEWVQGACSLSACAGS